MELHDYVKAFHTTGVGWNPDVSGTAFIAVRQ